MPENLEEQGLLDKSPENCTFQELVTIREQVHDHPSLNAQLWYEPYEEELLRRIRALAESGALDTALFEMQAVIDETEDPTDDEGEGHMTPLGRARKRIEEKAPHSFHPLVAKGYEGAIKTINEVAEETGADPTQTDPLTSDNFEHLKLLQAIRDGYEINGHDPLA